MHKNIFTITLYPIKEGFANCVLELEASTMKLPIICSVWAVEGAGVRGCPECGGRAGGRAAQGARPRR